MGFLKSLFGNQQEVQQTGNSLTPFKASLRFAPLRLSARKNMAVDLVVDLQNISGEKQMVSLDVMVPNNKLVGFERTCINKKYEKRVGDMMPGERKEVRISIWGNNQTGAGEYPVLVHVYSHYLDYSKVISYIKKDAVLRVV